MEQHFSAFVHLGGQVFFAKLLSTRASQRRVETTGNVCRWAISSFVSVYPVSMEHYVTCLSIRAAAILVSSFDSPSF